MIRLDRSGRDWSWIRGAKLAALTVAAGLIFVALLGGNFDEAYGLGTLFQLRGPDPAPPEVAVVAIDRASAESLRLPFPPPWPRTVHADLLRALKQRGAKVILLDLYFGEERNPESRSSENQVFAGAIGDAANVVLLQRMVRGTGAAAERDEYINPADVLRDGAIAVAPFPLPNVSARVTRFWTFRDGRPTLPSVALQLATLDLAGDWAAILKREGFSPQDAARPIVQSMSELRRQLIARPDAGDRLRPAIKHLEPVKATRLSALLNLYLGEDTRVLNFVGPPGTISTIPYASVINGQLGAVDVKGKIVVVGFDEREFVSNVDSYKTVYSGANGVDLSGVEILATAVANLMNDSTLESSGAVNLLILIVVGLVVGAIAVTSPRIEVMVAVAGFCLVCIFAAGYVAFTSANLVIPVIAPAAELMFGFVVTAALVMSAERKLRLSLEHTVRQWLPAEVADSVFRRSASAPGLPSGETHFAICLATDVQGFTAVAEKLPLAILNSLMRDYFEPFFAAVRRNGGVISNIAGDGALCAWKADPGSSEARVNAVRAALDISAGVRKFNERHPNTMFPTRIGLHAGEVVFSSVGGSGHYVAALLGDVANAVSRIESLNRELHTGILASEEALEGVEGFITRPLGTFLFEGRSQPISVVEILGSSGADAPRPLPIESFAAGMAAFDGEQWSEAVNCFENLHLEYPDDGPVSYFLGLAELYSGNPPPPGSSRPIRVNVK